MSCSANLRTSCLHVLYDCILEYVLFVCLVCMSCEIIYAGILSVCLVCMSCNTLREVCCLYVLYVCILDVVQVTGDDKVP